VSNVISPSTCADLEAGPQIPRHSSGCRCCLDGLFLFHAYQLVPESYASWTTSNVMVEYLRTHTNQWPHSWQDLRSATEASEQKGFRGVYTPLDRLPEFVKIDWQADIEHLRQLARNDSNATALVVTRLNGSKLRTIWGADTEPNRAILTYLRTQ
jgi:hypothetical protein